MELSPDYFPSLTLEEKLYYLTDGDLTKYNKYENMNAVDVDKLGLVKSKDVYLKWYAAEIQKEIAAKKQQTRNTQTNRIK